MSHEWSDNPWGDAVEMYEEAGAIDTDLRAWGAMNVVTGLAENGGLVGGAIENLLFNGDTQAIRDGAEAFRRFGHPEIAELVERAWRAYPAIRGVEVDDDHVWEDEYSNEVSEEGSRLWDELDEEWSSRAVDELVDVIGARLDPGLAAALERQAGSM